MGGAKWLGCDKGLPYSEQQSAFDFFLLWLLIGIPISLLLPMLIFPKLNFIISILIYILGIAFLFIRYLKIEDKNG